MNRESLCILAAGLVLLAGTQAGHAKVVNTTLLSNYVDSGDASTIIFSGDQKLESAKVNCPNTGGCTLILSAMAQIQCASNTAWDIDVLARRRQVGTLAVQSLAANVSAVGNWQGTARVPSGQSFVELHVQEQTGALCSPGAWSVNWGVAAP